MTISPRPLALHGGVPESATRPRRALAAKGFRPFFLLAAGFAAAVVPIWLLIVFGVLPAARYLDAASWHAHEMIFGFAAAVIAGFLLTAVGNWTQRETATGTPLLALAGLWLLGRAVMAAPDALPRGVAAVVDLAFLPALAAVLARPLLAARNRRNFVMLAVLFALSAANVLVHLDALGLVPAGTARRACLVAVDVVVFLMLVIAGRVLPMFTRNATAREDVVSSPRLDGLTALAAGTLVVVDVSWPGTPLAGAMAGIVAIAAVARAARWRARSAAKTPLLWILHLGHAWIPVGLLLRALPALGVPVVGSLATHALTVGAIGALSLGMMARVALGHTGRPLAAPRAMTWAFGAVSLAAVARVFVPLVALRWYPIALVAAGALWTVAFAIYLVVYAPVLAAPRVDGRAG